MIAENLFKMQNGLRFVKPNYIKIIVNLRYSSTTTHSFKQSIEILGSNLDQNKPINQKILSELIKETENEQFCDSKSGLILLKSCGLNNIDLFPSRRQLLNDYLFNNLFKKIKFEYQNCHYETYMNTTISNQSSFDPYKIANSLAENQLSFNNGICLSLITQLCDQNETKVAFLYLKQIIESGNLHFDSDKLDRYLKQPNHNTILAINLKSEHVELISPLIYYFLKNNDMIKSKELIELLEEKFYQLNRSISKSILKGNLIRAEYDKALVILKQQHDLFTSQDLLDLLYTSFLNKTYEKCEIYYHLVQLIQNKIRSEDVIYIVDLIYKLAREKKFNLVVEILKFFNKNEFGVNLNEYFIKSVFEYETEFENLIKTVGLYGDKSENLKKLLNVSLDEKNTEKSLKLISKIKACGELVQSSYFYPILDKEFSELVTNTKKSNKSIEKCLNYKRIDSILGKIRSEFNILMSQNDLIKILEIFQRNDRENLISFDAICRLFDKNRIFSTTILFNVSSDLIIESQLNYIDQNRLVKNFGLNANKVYRIFEDIQNLIINLNITIFNDNFLIKFNRYLIKLYETDLILSNIQLDQNKVIETLKTINQRFQQNEDYLLNEINKGFKQFCVEYASSSQIDLVLIYQVVERSLKKIPNFNSANLLFPKNLDYSDKSESVEDLINLIEELKSKEKNIHPSVRRLIMRLCYSQEVDNPIELIEKYAKILPFDQFTPKLCHDLMFFYVKQTFDFDKAIYYFERLKIFAKNNDTFSPDASKLVNFLEVLLNIKKIDLSDLEKIFKIFKWKNANDDQKNLDKINKFLNGRIFANLSPLEYKNLVECIFDSNIISRNTCFASSVLLRLIDSNQIDEAFDYFKFNLIQHKTSIGEVFLLKAFFKQFENKILTGTKLEELLLFFSKYYSQNVAFNFMFYAHCMNGDFYSANIIYNQNLNKIIDLNILERMVNQIGMSRLKRKYAAELKNISKLKCFETNYLLKNKIQKILNKLC